MKAGHSFKQGLQTVVEEGNPPASKEFDRVLAEARLGRPLERPWPRWPNASVEELRVRDHLGHDPAARRRQPRRPDRHGRRHGSPRQQFARKIKGLTAMGRAGAYVLIGLPFFMRRDHHARSTPSTWSRSITRARVTADLHGPQDDGLRLTVLKEIVASRDDLSSLLCRFRPRRRRVPDRRDRHASGPPALALDAARRHLRAQGAALRQPAEDCVSGCSCRSANGLPAGRFARIRARASTRSQASSSPRDWAEGSLRRGSWRPRACLRSAGSSGTCSAPPGGTGGVLMGALFLGVVGFLGPDYALSIKARRRRKIRSALPDSLDLLAVCVEAGLGLDGAIAKLNEYMEGPLAEEFGLTLSEMRIGESRPKRSSGSPACRRAGALGLHPRDHPGRPAGNLAQPHPPRAGGRLAPAPSGHGRGAGDEGSDQDALPDSPLHLPGHVPRHHRAGDPQHPEDLLMAEEPGQDAPEGEATERGFGTGLRAQLQRRRDQKEESRAAPSSPPPPQQPEAPVVGVDLSTPEPVQEVEASEPSVEAESLRKELKDAKLRERELAPRLPNRSRRTSESCRRSSTSPASRRSSRIASRSSRRPRTRCCTWFSVAESFAVRSSSFVCSRETSYSSESFRS